MALAFSCRQALFTSLVTLAAGTSLLACAGGATTESVGGTGGSGYVKDSGADSADVSVADSSADTNSNDSSKADTGSDVVSAANQCATCNTDTECGADFRCVASAFGDKFCAKLCDSSCSTSGYECVDLAEYPAKPVSDGGTSDGAIDAPLADSSTTDGSADASADASDDAHDSSPAIDAGAVVKACVPASGDSCACSAGREGVKRTCYKTNSWGSCPGTETCTSGSWIGCDAKSAAKEICDDKDNNCNGFVDMDEPAITGNELCAGGSAPPHSGFTCSGGTCELSGCEKGWAKYPATTPVTDGCNCKVDTGDVSPKNNSTCATATDLGELADVTSTPLTVTGTLSSDKDGQEGDWYAILAKDAKQDPFSNSFRIHVEFLAPDGNPNNEFLIDIIQGSAATPCTAQTTPKSSIAQWDWCADSLTDPVKPADDDQSAPIRIRVFRNPAATAGTCKPYTLRITNGGSGACPAKDTCGAT